MIVNTLGIIITLPANKKMPPYLGGICYMIRYRLLLAFKDLYAFFLQ